MKINKFRTKKNDYKFIIVPFPVGKIYMYVKFTIFKFFDNLFRARRVRTKIDQFFYYP